MAMRRSTYVAVQGQVTDVFRVVKIIMLHIPLALATWPSQYAFCDGLEYRGYSFRDESYQH
jgi:hypothetical protein